MVKVFLKKSTIVRKEKIYGRVVREPSGLAKKYTEIYIIYMYMKIYGRVVREGKPSGLAMHQRLLRERLVRCWQNGS